MEQVGLVLLPLNRGTVLLQMLNWTDCMAHFEHVYITCPKVLLDIDVSCYPNCNWGTQNKLISVLLALVRDRDFITNIKDDWLHRTLWKC